MKNKLNLSFLIVVVSLCLTLAMSAFAQDGSFDTQSPEAPAASLYVDNFTYSGALTNNGWAAHSGAGTNALSTTAGLTFGGYPGSGTGNGVLVGNAGGEDDSVLLTAPQTANGNVYYSILVNVNDAATDKTGDYFFHIGTRASTTSFVAFAARLFARIVGGNVNFGISNGSTTPVYGTTNFSKNTTYLVIVKYTLNTSGNDPVSVWVIPAASGVPATEAAAGTPEATETTTLGQDVIDALAIRQGSNATSTQEVVDGIRVGTTWADITGAAAPAVGGAHVFTTVMNGANETPANASTGRGFGRAVLSADETQLTASFYWEGLGSNTTIGHIHTGAAGVAGPITFDMAPAAGATSGTVVDKVFAITAAQVATLRSGGMYFNVHSTVFPAGELRGQLVAAKAKSDFDGDGKTDYGVLRAGATSNVHQLSWLIKLNGGSDIRKDWGLDTDVSAPGDYDGDGKEDVAVWRYSPSPAYIYVLRSSDSTFTITPFGVSGDIPVVRDYTGDGKADFAIYRSSTSTFWYNPSSGPFVGHPVAVPFGVSGDFAAPGDYNGDGKADFAVFHNTNGTGTFNIRYGTDSTAPSATPDSTTYFGRFTTDSPVAADYDGDGKTDIAVTRTEGSQIVWYYLPSTGGAYVRLGWGVAGDLQVPGDYDGDGKTDFAIWRASQTAGATAFYVLGSQNGFLFQQWGTSNDTPVNFDVLQ